MSETLRECKAHCFGWLLLLALAHNAHLANGKVGKLRVLPKLCEDCMEEPLESDYFGGTFGGDPPRRNAAALEDFEDLALGGHVLIVENASLGTAMAGWSCERLASEFPEARMRREYDWVKNPEDRNLQTLGNAKWTEVVQEGESAKERLQQDPNSPPFAPFYWGVREHRQGDIGSSKVVQKIKGLIEKSVPKFMDTSNGLSMFDNAEFWLGAKGTGARAHMDSHCISTLSVVLSGERRWRVGPAPRMPPGAGKSRKDDVLFDDGVAYNLGWKPMYEFVAKEGDAVIFPPGWIHETLNVADSCTAALTTQFVIPKPVRYWRSYYQRLRRIGDLNPCWKEMISLGSLGLLKKVDNLKLAEVKTFAENYYKKDIANKSISVSLKAFYDIDEDGDVSEVEFVKTFLELVQTEKALKREKAVRMPRPDMRLDIAEHGASNTEL